ncbi:427_t:CDS:2 [Racocetra fulgida]|uniref:427_t:CDS:1 n=1 Tax=Racocetra fulgida TaxID=60492 RepID=A0A9N9BQB4_9GLOM|nr:427_t:CDS:2 [Racocetra fulgida]
MTCNIKQIQKKSKIATNLEVVVSTISTLIFKTNKATDFLQIDNILKDYNDLEPALKTSVFDYKSANMIEVYNSSDEYDDENMLSYCINKVKRFITTQYQHAESLREFTKFALEIELDSELLDIIKID